MFKVTATENYSRPESVSVVATAAVLTQSWEIGGAIARRIP